MAALHLASSSRGSALVMRAISEMRSGEVRNFGGDGENGIHRDRHRQFASGAVVDDSSLGGNFLGALLLVLRPGFIIAVAEDLEINQAQADRAGPEHQDCSQQVKPFVRGVAGCARPPFSPLDKHGGPLYGEPPSRLSGRRSGRSVRPNARPLTFISPKLRNRGHTRHYWRCAVRKRYPCV